MPTILLRRARLVSAFAGGVEGERDVRLRDGLIDAIGDLSTADDDQVVQLDGHVLLPAALEPHAHLDKAFLAETIANPAGDLAGACEAMEANRHLIDLAGTIERAERAARLLATNGYRAVRTHVDVTLDRGLTAVEALTTVRERVRDLLDVEIVALAGWPLVGPAAADQRALLLDALDAGADVVGGCPHLEGTGTRAPTEYLLDVAADRGLPVDLHTDETLDPGVFGLGDLIELVEQGFPNRVTASHCVSLGMRPLDEQRAIAERVAAAGISVVALPLTNLFLQGRGVAPMPRGLTALDALVAAGATLCAGADNLQDPFNPLGRACPAETAGLMILAGHLRPDEAWSTVSAAAASTLGLAPGRVEEGAPADLVALRGGSLREAIAYGHPDRVVVRAGRVIAP